MNNSRKYICILCKGTGLIAWDNIYSCRNCGGKGWIKGPCKKLIGDKQRKERQTWVEGMHKKVVSKWTIRSIVNRLSNQRN